MTARLEKTPSELKPRLQALYGDRLVEMILYGSQARGDAVDGSDIDVLVVLKGEVNPGREIDRVSETVADICLRHEVVISSFFMDEQRFRERNGPLLRNVRREGVRI